MSEPHTGYVTDPTPPPCLWCGQPAVTSERCAQSPVGAHEDAWHDERDPVERRPLGPDDD
jgi:hypothetical protein